MSPLRVERVGHAERGTIIDFCRAHREALDGTWLSEGSLASFDPEGPNEAAFLLRDGADGLRGAASLMLKPGRATPGTARFRILHVAAGLSPGREEEGYRRLVEALLPSAAGLDGVYGYLPERAQRTAAILERLGFALERRSWFLGRALEGFAAPEFPPGFAIRKARLLQKDGSAGADAAAWCSVINLAFAGQAGFSDLLPSRLAAEIDPVRVFEGSWLILEEKSVARGIVQVLRDGEDGAGKLASLGPVAVRPAWQGRGLGRALIRAALASARDAGNAECRLSVSSDHEGAADLYLREGFEKREVYLCMRRLP